MTTKFSLNTQRMAFDLLCQDARTTFQKKCRRGPEAEHMYAASVALRNTLDWLVRHEEDIREWVRVQKELDREAPSE